MSFFACLFFFCVPQLDLWGSTYWVRCFRMCPFFNLTIEVVTFRLRGWCMLGVFLLPEFTRLGHEWQDFWSPCDGMHVCTDWTTVCTLIRKSLGGNGVRTHVNPKGKIPSIGKILLRGNSNPRRCIKQDSEPNALPTELFRPQRRIEPTTLHLAGQRAHHTFSSYLIYPVVWLTVGAPL